MSSDSFEKFLLKNYQTQLKSLIFHLFHEENNYNAHYKTQLKTAAYILNHYPLPEFIKARQPLYKVYQYCMVKISQIDSLERAMNLNSF